MTIRPLGPAAALAAALSALAPAQDATAVVRADDAVVLHIDGPARARGRFQVTNVGSVLVGRESQDFWSALRGPFDGLLRHLGDGAADVAPLLAQLEGYRGRMTVGVALRPQVGGVITLLPDGKNDLGVLAATLTQALTDAQLRPDVVRVGERDVASFFATETAGCTAPLVVDGNLLLFFGEKLRDELGRRFDAPAAGAFIADKEMQGAPFAIRIAGQRLLEAWGEDPWWLGNATAEEVATSLGLVAIDEYRLLVATEGPHVTIEQSLAFRPGKDRGVFAGLLPDSREAPALAALVPPEARFWQAGKMRPGVALLALARTAAHYTKDRGQTVAAAYAELRKSLAEILGGVDVQDDLFAFAADDILLLGDIFGGGDRRAAADDAADDDEAQTIGGAGSTGVFVVKLNDAATFEPALDRVLRNGLWFRPAWRSEVEERSGHTIHYTTRDTTAWAVTNEFAAIGSGPNSREWLRTLLIRSASMTDDDAANALPAPLRPLARVAPATFSGCGGFDVRGLVGAPFLQELGLAREFDDWLGDGWEKALDRLRPLLEQHDLERAAGFSGWQGDRWYYRVVW